MAKGYLETEEEHLGDGSRERCSLTWEDVQDVAVALFSLLRERFKRPPRKP